MPTHKFIGSIGNVSDLENQERAYPEIGMIYWVYVIGEPNNKVLQTVDYIERQGERIVARGSKAADFQDTAEFPITDSQYCIASRLRLNKPKRKKS